MINASMCIKRECIGAHFARKSNGRTPLERSLAKKRSCQSFGGLFLHEKFQGHVDSDDFLREGLLNFPLDRPSGTFLASCSGLSPLGYSWRYSETRNFSLHFKCYLPAIAQSHSVLSVEAMCIDGRKLKLTHTPPGQEPQELKSICLSSSDTIRVTFDRIQFVRLSLLDLATNSWGPTHYRTSRWIAPRECLDTASLMPAKTSLTPSSRILEPSTARISTSEVHLSRTKLHSRHRVIRGFQITSTRMLRKQSISYPRQLNANVAKFVMRIVATSGRRMTATKQHVLAGIHQINQIKVVRTGPLLVHGRGGYRD